MVKHIVLWNFKEELTAEERKAAGNQIKNNLEVLKAQIPGVLELEVKINELAGSNKDVALLSAFETVEALNAYQVHPAHVAAGSYIKTVTTDRVCFDYEV